MRRALRISSIHVLCFQLYIFIYTNQIIFPLFSLTECGVSSPCCAAAIPPYIGPGLFIHLIFLLVVRASVIVIRQKNGRTRKDRLRQRKDVGFIPQPSLSGRTSAPPSRSQCPLRDNRQPYCHCRAGLYRGVPSRVYPHAVLECDSSRERIWTLGTHIHDQSDDQVALVYPQSLLSIALQMAMISCGHDTRAGRSAVGQASQHQLSRAQIVNHVSIP